MTLPRSSGWEAGDGGKPDRMASTGQAGPGLDLGPVPTHRPNRSLVIKGHQSGHFHGKDPSCWSETTL